MNYYVDENVKNTKRIFPMQGRYDYYRYDMNENPEGLPEEFVNSVLKEVTPEFLSTYPEPDRFIKKYSDFIGCKEENILVTNGSDMSIRYLLHTFGEKGKDVITVSPSFEMYWVNCSLLGLNHKPILYNADLTLDVNKIVDSINEDTSIVVLLNPNSPIGTVYTEDEVQKIIKTAKKFGAIVIIDEAYHYFYPKTFLKYALEEENVILIRTFSKLLSLAACRLGIVISNPKLIQYVKNLRLTFDTNSIALLFGERLLDNKDIIQELIKIEKEGRIYLIDRLQENGYECIDGKGNFVLIKTKRDAHKISKQLEVKNKILVHAYGNDLLKEYIRVSTGSKKSMEVFINAFLKLDK